MRRLPLPIILVLFGALASAALMQLVDDRQGFFALLPRLTFILLGCMLASVLAYSLWSESALGRAVRNALSWALICGAVFAAYYYRDRLEWAGLPIFSDSAQLVAVLERESGAGGEKVVVERRRGGQFRVPVSINGITAIMLVDTGASIVTLTQADAKAAGIDIQSLDFSASIFTANGKTTAAPVIIDRLTIGSLERKRIPALVVRPGALERSLLGLTFLDTLASYSVIGDRLELTP